MMKVLESVSDVEFKLFRLKRELAIGLDRWEGLKVIIIQKKTLDSDQVEQKKKKKEIFYVKRKVVGPRALGGYYTSSHITYTGEVKVKEKQLILIKAERCSAK